MSGDGDFTSKIAYTIIVVAGLILAFRVATYYYDWYYDWPWY